MDYCRVIIASVVLLSHSDSNSFDMNASKSPDSAVMGISSPKFSLTCSYTLGTGETFISLSLQRKRSNENDFVEIITYSSPAFSQNVTYLEEGQLLESRTTVTRPTEENPSAVLTFDEIQCSDKAEYKWVGSYLTTSLQSKERTITFNIQAKSKFSNDGVISFTPSINIAEGDRITFTCEGDVGAEPAGSIAWYYYLDNSEDGILIGDSVSDSLVFNSTSCSNHRRSTMSMTLKKEFNRIVVRCTAQQTKYNQIGDGHIQTSHIPVYYSPRIMSINKVPNLSDYTEGMKTLTLTCQGEANPVALFYWKLPDNTTVESQQVTLSNLTVGDTGEYTCFAINQFLDTNHTVSQSLQLSIINSNQGTEGNDPNQVTVGNDPNQVTVGNDPNQGTVGTDHNQETVNTITIVLSVLVVVLVIVVVNVVIWLCLWNRRKKATRTSVPKESIQMEQRDTNLNSNQSDVDEINNYSNTYNYISDVYLDCASAGEVRNGEEARDTDGEIHKLATKNEHDNLSFKGREPEIDNYEIQGDSLETDSHHLYTNMVLSSDIN